MGRLDHALREWPGAAAIVLRSAGPHTAALCASAEGTFVSGLDDAGGGAVVEYQDRSVQSPRAGGKSTAVILRDRKSILTRRTWAIIVADMQYVRFGNTGMEVSRLCLGGMMFSRKIDPDGTRRVIDEAIERGVNFIDTAESYGESEDFIGRALQGRRDKVYLATKVYTHRAGETAGR